MPVQKSQYEALLSEYSNRDAAVGLLREYRPYLEMIPSLRRPYESVIILPLPVVRLRYPKPANPGEIHSYGTNSTTCLPCDLAMVMCDPEWKIKMGVEILVYIHRPHEDFSDLLMRWRKTQVMLDGDYEWLMPLRHRHILSEGAERAYPLFVVFSETSERIQRGLAGASLPFVIHASDLAAEEDEEMTRVAATDGLELGELGDWG
ncbi:MAG: hypothetical protein SAJ12_05190 [Jaaginema sp. PMC 1079.18]|nr:hypothetical protein [Jaaginema sp. PMC 1080.18]MEC4850388.1 hypothetical protein [Jaaginema sp. PMC 1079.18]MEC4866292.1 hypothetical protein [Jaaginema sp. PMC 1078.18]